jgi:hypothetical protein
MNKIKNNAHFHQLLINHLRLKDFMIKILVIKVFYCIKIFQISLNKL